MLDILDNRLAKAQAFDANLTVARFELDRRNAELEAEGDRPRVKEVRFEGDHLLDSLAACRLIAVDGRALIDLSMRVSFGPTDPEAARFPVRIHLDRDHALVLTGFGRNRPELSADLHRGVVRAVEREFEDGVANVRQLELLAERISKFARSDSEANRATMLRGSPRGEGDDPPTADAH